MVYQPHWSQGGTAGRVQPGQHWAKGTDVAEIAAAINRRFQLVYRAPEDYSSGAAAGLYVRTPLYDAETFPPFSNFQYALESLITAPAAGKFPGDPPSPTSMAWLWHYAGADENKVIVNGFQGVGAGQVSLFNKINGGTDWTDGILSDGITPIRAVHLNEFRRAVEILSRGRWILPVYASGGIFSPVPDEPWASNMLYNYDGDELRCVAFVELNTALTPSLGLRQVTVRTSSKLTITASDHCRVSVYQCHPPIDFVNDPPSWNAYGSMSGRAWSSPGAIADSTYIGAISCTKDVPASLTGPAAAQLFQLMVDGAANNLLLCRTDTGAEPVTFTAQAQVEFDLASPPN